VAVNGLIVSEPERKSVKASIEVELQPFTTPNFVLTVQPPRPKQEGFVETPKLALSDLDSNTLERMCDDFRSEVFKKAGKSRPPQEAPYCRKCRDLV
jgi:hypothetical protein